METPQKFDVVSMLKNMLLQDYEPAGTDAKAVNMSTRDVYEALYAVYPSNDFTPALVAEWLAEAGFKLKDFGELRLLWQISRKT